MRQYFTSLLEAVGEDVNREGLRDTPERAEKALRFLTSGYKENLDALVNQALFASDNDEMIIMKNIEFYSLCEHHMLPFFGTCHVGYLPKGKIIGFSKVPRLVEAFSRRLQVQENLTMQIAQALQHYTDAAGIGVVMEAQHLCVMMRGVEKENPVMKTSCMLGAFRDNAATRAEFIQLVT